MRKSVEHLAREQTELPTRAVAAEAAPAGESVSADPRALSLVREMGEANEGVTGLWGYTFEARAPKAVEAFLRLGTHAFFDRGAVRVNFAPGQAAGVAIVALDLRLEPIGNVSRG